MDLNREEEWRPVVGWEGLYEVSSHGRVRSLPRERETGHRKYWPGGVLRLTKVGSGHLVLTLRNAPRRQQVYVHRVVAEAFLENPDSLPIVRHLDDNPGDNRVSNLAWGTYKENTADRYRNNPVQKKTHCVRGHEFSEENTRYQGRGRVCKKCNTLLARNSREKKRASLTLA